MLAGLGGREIRSFYSALEVAAKLDWVAKLAMRFGSDQAQETYKWLSAAPALREWIGERLAKGLSVNGLTIINKTFEASLKISTDDIRRDKTDQIDVRIADLARRYLSHYAKLLSVLIANAAGATSGLAYDGQYYFDTDHLEGDSGTQKNLLTASEVGQLDVGTATAPTAYEAAQAVLGVIAYMLNLKDDQGEPIHENAQEFVVMTGPLLMPAFAAATTLKTINTGSGSVDNPLVLNDASIKVTHVTNPRLSSWTANFAIFRTDAPTKPFIIQEEEALTTQIIGAGSEYEKLNNAQFFGVKSIGNAGFGLWQHAAKATMG
ncbi:MAG: Mu-like prophage major head subunit gpT family protein [Gammaproteobacteria bacterium]|nr:Mu-like prophage major head subunit gpT family protein [Gammaproteobacteria bacterium]